MIQLENLQTLHMLLYWDFGFVREEFIYSYTLGEKNVNTY